jgi:hypothetical protein
MSNDQQMTTPTAAGTEVRPGPGGWIAPVLAWTALAGAAVLVAIAYLLISGERYPDTDLDQPDPDSLLVARFFSVVALVLAGGAGALALVTAGRQKIILASAAGVMASLAVLRLILTAL